nr:hydantoinase B/oxoprolinase family protein [Rhabdobacter roseus]
MGIDPQGQTHRAKVLSSGYLKGRLVRKIDSFVFEFDAPWAYPSRLLEGYWLLAPESGQRSKLLSINYLQKTLILEDNLTPLTNTDFVLTRHEEAPVLATRLVTQTALGDRFPELDMRLGTTKGTNALLERKGAKTLLVATKGFGDVLRIGTQQRPHLFQLAIPEPTLLYDSVLEIDQRVAADGTVLKAIGDAQLQEVRAYCQKHGFESVAVSLLNAYQNPEPEHQIANYLRRAGVRYLSPATQLSASIHYLRRTQTAVVNAYLAPVLDSYLTNIRSVLGDASIQVMTSAGGLVGLEAFNAKDSLLSGPAGGLVAATHLAKRLGYERVLTFDMGGTSTDAARIQGRADLRYLTQIEGLEIHNPTLDIETVAAGGGSICWFDGFALRVGPESAGAQPGPACYGAGGPLTLTDVNLLMGKLDTARFGIPIQYAAAAEALGVLREQIRSRTGQSLPEQEILTGLERIANEKMAEAIRRISVARGVDPKEYALLTFGGAGGLHGCQLADLLGITTVLVPYDAGLLSAYGMGQARISRIVSRQVFRRWPEVVDQVPFFLEELHQEALAALRQEGIQEVEPGFCSLFMRYAGQESSLEVPYEAGQSLARFEELYQTQFGYLPAGRVVELESIRLMVREKSPAEVPLPTVQTKIPASPVRQLVSPYFPEEKVHVFDWDQLPAGSTLAGPASLLNSTSTTYVPAGWALTIQEEGHAILTRAQAPLARPAAQAEEIELELFTNRFASIALEMGAQLQRTAFSVNVKERLDFSCALLDAEGELLVNAPHIPVHLGSLGICARLVRDYIRLGPGDVVITNHPKYGGSHLPDVTLLAGVFTQANACVGYVINRAHHAEIGGTKPGSMPPDALHLHEEGVVILPQYLVKAGEVQWETLRALFTQAPYPTRTYAENEADIIAALSSLRSGQRLLLKLVAEQGVEKVAFYMQRLKENAYEQLRQALLPYLGPKLRAVEYLDDGHRIALQVTVTEQKLHIDFQGTSHVHPKNLNANISILYSALLYVLRLLVNKDIPLNEGLLRNLELSLPPDSFLHPLFDDDPQKCPAVVGGNTEVSQRLVDTLLKAFGLAACSQGTMNNLLFGNAHFGYYETIGGGAGAGPGFHGRSGVHQHMTNTRITDPEELERRYPVRLVRFGIRASSGGAGKWRGGDGIVRELEFLEELEITFIGQHNNFSPYGLACGAPGLSSQALIIRRDGRSELCPGMCSSWVQPGDRLLIQTPGGGGYGEPESQ